MINQALYKSLKDVLIQVEEMDIHRQNKLLQSKSRNEDTQQQQNSLQNSQLINTKSIKPAQSFQLPTKCYPKVTYQLISHNFEKRKELWPYVKISTKQLIADSNQFYDKQQIKRSQSGNIEKVDFNGNLLQQELEISNQKKKIRYIKLSEQATCLLNRDKERRCEQIAIRLLQDQKYIRTSKKQSLKQNS